MGVSVRTSDRDAVAGAAAVLDMRQRLERAGEVLFLKTYGELQRTVVIFGSIEEATTAKRSLEEAGFEAHYGLGADRETVRNFHLAPPAPEKMFLLSPPPSPPEGWTPLYEGINSIPHFNVELNRTPGDNVLLKGERSLPTITLDDFDQQDDNTRGGGQDTGAVFTMDD